MDDAVRIVWEFVYRPYFTRIVFLENSVGRRVVGFLDEHLLYFFKIRRRVFVNHPDFFVEALISPCVFVRLPDVVHRADTRIDVSFPLHGPPLVGRWTELSAPLCSRPAEILTRLRPLDFWQEPRANLFCA